MEVARSRPVTLIFLSRLILCNHGLFNHRDLLLYRWDAASWSLFQFICPLRPGRLVPVDYFLLIVTF